MARLALQLLTYHRTKTLGPLFASLGSQIDMDWTLYVFDNASSVDERRVIKQVLDSATEKGMRIVYLESNENIGFDAGHELLYHEHDADYVMCVNDDVILEPEYIARLRRCLDDHPDLGAVTGRILRWYWDGDGVRSAECLPAKTEIVDSFGLKKTRYHGVFDIDAGKKAFGRSDPIRDPIPVLVWGVSGCLPMYRRLALGDRLFDPAYFMYKEDVDVAYRLNKTGWKAARVDAAVAYHLRTFKKSFLHKGVAYRSQMLSYRNHWRNLLRHLTWRDWLKDGWAILPFEAAKAVYILAKVVFHLFV